MVKKKVHKDQYYIEGLLQNNSFIIKAIYDKFTPKVINYIKNNNGSIDQAEDIIQETLIVIYEQAKEKKLQLTCPFDAYFFLLCKRKWLNKIKKNSLNKVTINDEILSNYDSADLLSFETSIFEEKQNLFNEMFKQLNKSCKELLEIVFKTDNMQEAASTLGISYAYARKKKSQCIGALTKLVKDSPLFNLLK